MVNTPHSRANSTDLASARSSSTINPDVPWSVVTAGKGKHRNKKQQQLISFKPTFVQPLPSTTESNQALSGQTPPAPVELVVPFIKGVEKGSVLIDTTHVKNFNLLREALDAFNKDSDTDGNGYNEFLGRCEKTRTYLNHVFMETLWAPNSASYNTIVNEGIMLSDNTFIKRFPSYSADSSIIRLTLSGLPFLQLSLLKKDLEKRLQRFGKVLDFGLSKKDGYYIGGGYATIELHVGKPCHGTSCSVDHVHYEPLQREIIWDEDDEEFRKVLLSWDAMPDFCRICGSSDHCRADCPDLKSWLKCYNCNKTGHIWKHCPRSNTAFGNEAQNKSRAVPEAHKKNSRKTPLKVNNSTTSPMIVDKPQPQVQSPVAPPPALSGAPGSPTDNVAETTHHNQLDNPVTPGGSSTEKDYDSVMKDAVNPQNKHTNERSVSPEPQDSTKVAKTKGSSDVSVGRKKIGQGTGSNNEQIDTNNVNMNTGTEHIDDPNYGGQPSYSNQQ